MHQFAMGSAPSLCLSLTHIPTIELGFVMICNRHWTWESPINLISVVCCQYLFFLILTITSSCIANLNRRSFAMLPVVRKTDHGYGYGINMEPIQRFLTHEPPISQLMAPMAPLQPKATEMLALRRRRDIEKETIIKSASAMKQRGLGFRCLGKMFDFVMILTIFSPGKVNEK